MGQENGTNYYRLELQFANCLRDLGFEYPDDTARMLVAILKAIRNSFTMEPD